MKTGLGEWSTELKCHLQFFPEYYQVWNKGTDESIDLFG